MAAAPPRGYKTDGRIDLRRLPRFIDIPLGRCFQKTYRRHLDTG